MKVNISLTTIRDNLHILEPTLYSLLNQSQRADRIVLYVSVEPYLQDKGILESDIPDWLKELPVEVRFVKNTGPYRKLLPLLEEIWDKDEIIITVDDDTYYNSDLVKTMVQTYKETGACVGCRCTHVGDPTKNEYENLQQALPSDLYNYHTGKGAVLYHPSMFKHKEPQRGILGTEFLELAPTNDDHWFNIWRMYNDIPCIALKFPYMNSDLTNKEFALFHNYNERLNKLIFRKTTDFVFSHRTN